MIRFRCHRCKRPIAAPDGYVGKKVKCPGCMIVTIVPDIPGATEAKANLAKPVRAAPPLPQAPPDPLDELASAVSGEVETASFDEAFAAYEHSQFQDPMDDIGTAARAPRRRVRRKVQQGMEVVDVLLCVLVPMIALIIGIVRSSSGNSRAGGQMIKLSLVVMVIAFLLGIIIGLIQHGPL